MKHTHHLHLIAILSFAVLFSGVFSYFSIAKAAFGTSPPWVMNDHMIPGTTFEQVINLSRSTTEEALKANVRISGDKDLVQWISIPDKDNLILNKGQKTLPMKVIVNAPKKAALKRYTGSIYVALTPVVEEKLDGGTVGIALGANITVDITLTGTVVSDYKILSMLTDSIQEGFPFSIRVQVTNMGNVDVTELEGEIDIYDSAKKEILHTLPLIPLMDPVAPNETKYSRMTFEEVELPAGDYWVVAKAIKEEQVIYENHLLLQILPREVAVIMPEDVNHKKPSLPALPEQTEEELAEVEVEATTVELRPVAPQNMAGANVFLIFGLAGLGLGLVALIGLIVVLIMVLKNQRQPMISGYNMGSGMMPPAMSPPPMCPPPVSPPPTPQSSPPQPSAGETVGTNPETKL